MSKTFRELSPKMIASAINMADWNHLLNDHASSLGLSRHLDPDPAVRAAAAADAVDWSMRPLDAPANWNGLRAFKEAELAKIGHEDRATAQAERKFLEDTYKEQYAEIVRHSKEINSNILLLAQWVTNSVSPENLLPIFGSLPFNDIFGRVRAIRLRYQTSNRHGVITSLSKLLEVKMTSESQASAHVFIDKIKSLMLRIRTHLRDGELDLVQVIEIMVLINGLSTKDGWPVLAMALSTDEALSFEVMCERILQQAERLSVSNSRGRSEASPSVGGGAGKGVAKAVNGNKKTPKVSSESGQGQTEKFRPYWHGQHTKSTYQPSAHFDETDRPTLQSNPRNPGNPSDGPPQQKPNKNKGKWRKKGKAYGHGEAPEC